jgi:hypothetical protein
MEIHHEFAEDPHLNLGLVLGPRYGLIEIAVVICDGRESHREYYELMNGECPETPSFESRHACHYIFAWDKRLGSLGLDQLRLKSTIIRLGAGESGAYTILPPSTVDGFERYWSLTIDDYDGGIGRLPNHAVEKIIAAAKQVDHREAA